MTMATESLLQPQDSRGIGIKGAVLCKQSEIEEDEQDTSPGSDQSDATITSAGRSTHGVCLSTGPESNWPVICHLDHLKRHWKKIIKFMSQFR